MTEHKKYWNNKAQRQFKAVQQLALKKVAKINMEKRKVARDKSKLSKDKSFVEIRKLLNIPELGPLSDFI